MNIEDLLKDEEFAAKVDAVSDDLNAVVELFKEKGIEISVEDLQKGLAKAESGELNEENLEDVAGGSLALTAAGIGIAFLVGYLKGRKSRR